MTVQALALVVDETTPDDDLKRAEFAVDRRTGVVIKDRRGRAGVHHYPAPRPHDPRDLCTIDVGTADAMIVGLEILTLARTKRIGETARGLERVGKALVAAARRALAEGK